ncbi:MAG: universal stress protein [Ardenticatenaceae bacterium]|nr:universal stress protein [Anaerolineales bacterium]MCB8919665.1 universal stress protein [Ardenticatenaceae bacterium]
MSAEELPEQIIRRILVALDASTDSVAALKTAASLAASLQAELVGLFVEDINLLRLAGLPFASEVQRVTGTGRVLDEAGMERDLQLQASQARRALANAAADAEATWTFRVVRGVVTTEILAAALEADLLTLGRASRPPIRRRQLGSTARAAVSQAPGPVLLGHPGMDLEQPVLATFDGTPAAAQALVAAANMARSGHSDLVVLLTNDVPGRDSPSARELAEQCEAILSDKGYSPPDDYEYLPHGDQESLVRAAQARHCGLLVLGGSSPLLQGERLQHLLDELYCPVMLVR